MNKYDRVYLEAFYPRIAEKISECKVTDDGYLLKLNNGEVWIFDLPSNQVIKLPDDSEDMTKLECSKEFGRKLSRMMWRKNVSQKMLSERTGISQSTISNYIRGTSDPSFYNLDKIAKALNCSIDYFRYMGF